MPAVQEPSTLELPGAGQHGARSRTDAGVNQDQSATWSLHQEAAERELQPSVGVQEAAVRSPLLLGRTLERRDGRLHHAVEDGLHDQVADVHLAVTRSPGYRARNRD